MYCVTSSLLIYIKYINRYLFSTMTILFICDQNFLPSCVNCYIKVTIHWQFLHIGLERWIFGLGSFKIWQYWKSVWRIIPSLDTWYYVIWYVSRYDNIICLYNLLLLGRWDGIWLRRVPQSYKPKKVGTIYFFWEHDCGGIFVDKQWSSLNTTRLCIYEHI